MTEQKKFGFTAIVGPTNAGKSTLINALIGHKISIVSRKVQTTRTRVVGIMTHGASQFVFLDTPGLFQAKKRLDRAMIQAAEMGMEEADMVLLVLDASKPVDVLVTDVQKCKDLLERNAANKPLYLALNKIDKIPKETLLEKTVRIAEHMDAEFIYMISALDNDGVEDLIKGLDKNLKAGPWMYAEDEIYTMPFRLMAAEVTREKVMDLVHQEIPYAVTVVTDHVEQFDNGDFKLMQTILVEKNSQKTVLVGKAGSKIKEIGKAARLELSEIFEGNIHLNLFVKVKKDWQNDPEYYRLWGLSE